MGVLRFRTLVGHPKDWCGCYRLIPLQESALVATGLSSYGILRVRTPVDWTGMSTKAGTSVGMHAGWIK